MNNFDKDFQRSKKIFNIFFCVVLIITVVLTVFQLSATGYIGYKIISAFETADAREVAKELGSLVKAFNEGQK